MMRTSAVVAVFFAAFFICGASSVNAKDSRKDPDHKGLFMRFTCGIGGVTSKADSEADSGKYTASYDGADLNLGLSIGGFVVNNLAVSFDLFNTNSLIDLFGGDNYLVTIGYGLGVNYYFMPHDIFVGGSIGGAFIHLYRLSFDEECYSGGCRASNGYGFQLFAGKEWNGLGAAAQFIFVNAPLYDGAISFYSINILFTATYD